MARKTLYLIGILLAIIIGSILYYNYCSNCRPTAVAKANLSDSAVTAAKPDSTATAKPDSAVKATQTTDWSAIKEKLNADPLIFHFETGHTEISLTAQETQKMSAIVNYLGHTDGSTLNIVGYSDNVGKRESNIKIGLKRAEFAKSYFVKNGVDANKIKTSSKGPDEPVADNTTPEGKSKNRRTVVTIN
ncbi:MAG: OmpA/MotB domain protein [Mucilaginibacter sp.]|nr:OmpA/MotB domain protein [Mucilaginibacter sp.]